MENHNHSFTSANISTLQSFQKEIRLRQGWIPALGGGLEFANPPGLPSVDVPPPENNISQDNLGLHALLPSVDANRDYLETEQRLRDILNEIQKLSLPRTDWDIISLRDDVHFDAYHALELLKFQKETEWQRQRHAKRRSIDTGMYRRWYHPSDVVMTAYLTALIGTTFFHLPWSGVKFICAGMRIMSRLPSSQEAEQILKDPLRVLFRYPLDPVTQVFACCPKCGSLHPYGSAEQRDLVPYACTHQSTSSSDQCGELLQRTEHHRPGDRRVPVLKFEQQDIKHCVGRWLMRPGVEDMLENAFRRTRHPDAMTDCWDAGVLHNLLGPDKLSHFLPGPEGSLRLVFGISQNPFDPFRTKTSKQSVSSTGTWLFCLNFPMSLRFLEQYVCFVSVIPGPGKPSLDQINHANDLIVDVFKQFWTPGVHYTQTYKHPSGRLVEAIFVPLLSDMLTVRQAVGFSDSSSRRFCTSCDLDHNDIENLDKTTWPVRKPVEHIRSAFAWRKASSQEQKDVLFADHMVRWSPFFRLPYWNPIRFTPESSRALNLGLIALHFQNGFHINLKVPEDMATPEPFHPAKWPEDDVLDGCYAVIKRNGRNLQQVLKRQPKAVLLYISEDLGLRRPDSSTMDPDQLAQQLVEWRQTADFSDHPQFAESTSTVENENISASESSILASVLNRAFESESSDASSGTDTKQRRRRGRRFSESDTQPRQARVEFDKTIPPTAKQAKDIEMLKRHICEERAWNTVSRLNKIIFQYLCSELELSPDGTVQNLHARLKKNRGLIAMPVGDEEKLKGAQKSKGRRRNDGRNLDTELDDQWEVVLGVSVITQSWVDIGRTQVPSWTNKAPADWGTSKGGSLSCGQWHAIALIHLPVTLIKLWGFLPEADRRRQLLDNYMQLVTAVTLATLRTVTPDHIKQYENAMSSYLHGYKGLYKDATIHPIHHFAMHHGDHLRAFGPSAATENGDSYERRIHQLPEIHPHQTFGELEATMLRTACRGSNLRTLLSDPVVAERASKVAEQLKENLDYDFGDTHLAHMVHESRPTPAIAYRPSSAEHCTLAEDVYLQVCQLLSGVQTKNQGLTLPRTSLSVSHVSLRGVHYTTFDHTPEDSDIVYHAKGVHAVGQITHIFIYRYQLASRTSRSHASTHESVFVVVKPYKTLREHWVELASPYLRYGSAGGWLCERELLRPTLVSSTSIMSHFAKTPIVLDLLDLFHILPLDKLMDVPTLVKQYDLEDGRKGSAKGSRMEGDGVTRDATEVKK